MSISRVMNMPDGSTPPVQPQGAGDINGSQQQTHLAGQAGTSNQQISTPRSLHFGSSTMGVTN